MTTHDEILFGRIAVLSKFVTEEQVDECLKIQLEKIKTNISETAHLGSILVSKGYLKEREKRAILMVQKENLQRKEVGSSSRRQERIFGYLVMRLGLCTEQQVYECVREQARLMRFNLFFRLGEVFVSKKFLTHEQVKEILALQGKFIITCNGCKTLFNVVRYQAGSKVKCPECASVIEVPDILCELKKDSLLKLLDDKLEEEITDDEQMENVEHKSDSCDFQHFKSAYKDEIFSASFEPKLGADDNSEKPSINQSEDGQQKCSHSHNPNNQDELKYSKVKTQETETFVGQITDNPNTSDICEAEKPESEEYSTALAENKRNEPNPEQRTEFSANNDNQTKQEINKSIYDDEDDTEKN